MTRRQRVGLTAAGLVVVGLGSSAATLASLWLPWHWLPPAELKVAMTRQAGVVLAQGALLPPEVASIAVSSWQLAYARAPGEMLVVFPAARSSRTTRAVLTGAGWQVVRRGPYLVAARDTVLTTPGTVLPALVAWAKTATISVWPLWPTLLAVTPPGLSAVDQPLLIVAAASPERWQVVVTDADPPGRLAVPPPAESDRLLLHSPGMLWRQTARAGGWDQVLARGLDFERTRPAVAAFLGQFPAVTILWRGSLAAGEAAVAVDDTTEQFVGAATAWVQEEERRGRLVSRAFRLPDGSLGYEKIPGEAAPVFTPPDRDNCRGPLEGRTTLWLCTRPGRAALGRSKGAAQQALDSGGTSTFAIQVGAPLRTLLPSVCTTPSPGVARLACQVQQLSWQGDMGQHALHFKLAE